MAKLFSKTIKQLKKLIKETNTELKEDLEREIASKTGGDNWHNPHKHIVQAKQFTLEELRKHLNEAELLSKPENKDKTQQGHKVTVNVSTGQGQEDKMTFHLCDSIDTEILTPQIRSNTERMLSVETPLAKRLLSKRVGDIIEHEFRTYEILNIKKSNLL